MTEIVNLRPHHIAVLTEHLAGSLLLAKFVKNPESRDLAMFAGRELFNRERYRRIYKGLAWAELERIGKRVTENPNIFVRIVQGGDDICAECIFAEKCLRGDYSEVKKAYESEGIDAGGGTSDRDSLAKLKPKRDYGDIKTARELFDI
jgi:hypothetical protein